MHIVSQDLGGNSLYETELNNNIISPHPSFTLTLKVKDTGHLLRTLCFLERQTSGKLSCQAKALVCSPFFTFILNVLYKPITSFVPCAF